MQNSSKLEYFHGLVAMYPNLHRESPATALWFVGYSNRTSNDFLPFWFWDGAIAISRNGQFIRNSSKLEYFYGLVATSLAHHGESPARQL
jgi:hypothetical protein